jgi:hypothetical protein
MKQGKVAGRQSRYPQGTTPATRSSLPSRSKYLADRSSLLDHAAAQRSIARDRVPRLFNGMKDRPSLAMREETA